MLDRWLAHHVAELMVRADEASGPDKAAAEARVVDIILKLWANRRALPAQADPLGGYRRAITVLGALAPEANPWARHSGSGTEEALLRELFETMSRVVVGGVLLTTSARSRALGAEMTESLEPGERRLQAALDRWIALLAAPQTPRVEVRVVDPSSADTTASGGDLEASGSAGEDGSPEGETLSAEDSVHSLTLENLERLHTDLGRLLARWRRPGGTSETTDEEGAST